MPERPILFSGPMVRALLAGTKTQTRRVVTTPLWEPLQERAMAPDCGIWRHADGVREVRCPFGRLGDRMWVREAWALVNDDGYAVSPSTLCYRAVGPERLVWPTELLSHEPLQIPRRGWRPSIHMPRWASRITLELTGVRVERVQDISESDAVAEAAASRVDGPLIKSEEFGQTLPVAIYQYAKLWNSLNAPRGYGWGANPWVWVLEFRVAATPEVRDG